MFQVMSVQWVTTVRQAHLNRSSVSQAHTQTPHRMLNACNVHQVTTVSQAPTHRYVHV